MTGIYEKAELRKKEAAESGEETVRSSGFHFHVWQGMAAAACFCLVLIFAVYGRRTADSRDTENNDNDIQSVNFIAEQSLEEDWPNGAVRTRTAEVTKVMSGTVLEYTKSTTDSMAVLCLTEDGAIDGRIEIYVDCEAEFTAGEQVKLILTAAEGAYYLTDSGQIYTKKDDGLYYNAEGTAFPENAGGK